MTTWSYVMIFDNAMGPRDRVTKFLDEIPEVTFWFTCMENSVFFTSSLTAGRLAERAIEHFGINKEQGKRFLITEVHRDRQGWLPMQAWHMFKNPDDPRLKS